jgi:hypothetical protein
MEKFSKYASCFERLDKVRRELMRLLREIT